MIDEDPHIQDALHSPIVQPTTNPNPQALNPQLTIEDVDRTKENTGTFGGVSAHAKSPSYNPLLDMNSIDFASETLGMEAAKVL